MSDLSLFVAIIGRLWWLWSILLGGMVLMMLGEYLEYTKEDEDNV